jgi:alpha-galactosidase
LILRKWDIELGLVDVDPEALSVAEKLAGKMLKAKKAKMKVTASTDRRKVLRGATVVICTIGVGGRRAWEQDVFVPRKYGIYQPVGDSVMPGGTSRALRMIPPMVAVARDVLDLCPNALFFNYGNPMAPVCRAVRKATGANMIGLCHGVNHVGHYLADNLGVSPADVKYTAIGMNHLTWFTEFRVKGQDAMPQLRALARKRAQVPDTADLGKKFAEAGTGDEKSAATDSPFSWQLMNLFGAFPAVLDRHVIEFFPQCFRDGTQYGKKLGVDAYSLEDTIAWGDKGYEEMRQDAFSKKPLRSDYFDRIGGEHEQVVDIIESIRHDRGRIYSANLPNLGQAPNLPENAVVEAPAVADGAGLRALVQKPLPVGVAGTLATRLLWVETVVEAALEGSRTKFIQALVLDGWVNSIETAERLGDELLSVHARYLPQFKKANKKG